MTAHHGDRASAADATVRIAVALEGIEAALWCLANVARYRGGVTVEDAKRGGDHLRVQHADLIRERAQAATRAAESTARVAEIRAADKAEWERKRAAAKVDPDVHLLCAFGLGRREYNALERWCMTHIAEIDAASDAELLALRNFGETALLRTRRAVAAWKAAHGATSASA